MFVCLWNKQNKPNQTQPKQTKNPIFCLFVKTNYPNQTKPNFLNNNFKINCFKKLNPKYLKSLLELCNSCTDLYLFEDVCLGNHVKLVYLLALNIWIKISFAWNLHICTLADWSGWWYKIRPSSGLGWTVPHHSLLISSVTI